MRDVVSAYVSEFGLKTLLTEVGEGLVTEMKKIGVSRVVSDKYRDIATEIFNLRNGVNF